MNTKIKSSNRKPTLIELENKISKYLKKVSTECYDNGCNIISESQFDTIAKNICRIIKK